MDGGVSPAAKRHHPSTQTGLLVILPDNVRHLLNKLTFRFHCICVNVLSLANQFKVKTY